MFYINFYDNKNVCNLKNIIIMYSVTHPNPIVVS